MKSLLPGFSILMLSASAMAANSQELQLVPETPRETVPREELIDPQDPSVTEPEQPDRISMSRACVQTASLRAKSGISFRIKSRDGATQGYLIPHQDGIRFILGSGTAPGDMTGIHRVKPQDPLSTTVEVLFAAFRQKSAIHVTAVDPEKPSRHWVYDVESISLTYADCE